MPVYVYQCSGCSARWEEFHTVAERHEESCSTCVNSKLFIVPQVQKFMPFHEGVYEHIAKDPMYITSKKRLKDECRARDVTSKYIVD